MSAISVKDNISVEASDIMPVENHEPQFNANTFEFHSLANLFPLMSKEDFTGLVEDMKAHGYREDKPIWMYEGQILEGRNRYNAALQAGVTPTYAHYAGNDPITFVLQENLHRRHLSSSQKAVIALELEKVLAEEARKRQLATLKQNQSEDTVCQKIDTRTEETDSEGKRRATQKTTQEQTDSIPFSTSFCSWGCSPHCLPS